MKIDIDCLSFKKGSGTTQAFTRHGETNICRTTLAKRRRNKKKQRRVVFLWCGKQKHYGVHRGAVMIYVDARNNTKHHIT